MGRPSVFPGSGGGSSSSDEEANQDLSLEIVERAKRRRGEGSNMIKGGALEASAGWAPPVVDPLSSDEADAFPERRNGGATQTVPACGEAAAAVEGSRRKKKKKIREKKQKEADEKEGAVRGETEAVDRAVAGDEEVMETADSGVTDVNDDICDGIVLRKLLRGPRYFDLGISTQLESCYNCGGEGHKAGDCTAEKRRKPCFVCGMFGHNAYKCSQGQSCVICKRRGHRAKDCPDEHQNTSGDSNTCFRCGDLGHDMSSCRNGYPPDDLKKIHCYVCKSFGHFCCVNLIDTLPREVSCYNCGDSGHSGMGCANPRGRSSDAVSPTLCYVCGEEGHFARGCTRTSKINRWPIKPSAWWPGELSTPGLPSRRKKDITASKSLPHYLGRGYSRKSMQSEGTRNMTAEKPKAKVHRTVDSGELPRRIPELRSLVSPKTPKASVEMSYKYYQSAGSSYDYMHG